MAIRPRSCLTLAAVAAGLGALLVPSGSALEAAAPPPTVYVAASGNDGACAPGDAKRPCASFGRAFQIAPCGATVRVRAGTYPAQSIRPRSSTASCAKDTTFAPERGASVTVNGNLDISASRVAIAGTETPADAAAGRRAGFNVNWGVMVSGDRVQVARTNAKGSVIAGGTNVTFAGMNFGPLASCEYGDSCADDLNGGFHQEDLVVVQAGKNADGSLRTSTNVTIRDSYLHDLTKVSTSQYPQSGIAHADCIQLFSWSNVTLSGNRFHGCPDTNIFAGYADGSSATYDNLHVEGNVFDPAGSGSFWSSQFACTNMTFRANVVHGQDALFRCPNDDPRRAVVEHNVLPSVPFQGCDGTTRRYNVYTSEDARPCDATEAVVRPKLLFLEGSGRDSSVRVRYVLVSEVPLKIRTTVYAGSRVLVQRAPARPLGAVSGVASFSWRNKSGRRATRFCVRATDAGGAGSIAGCTPLSG